VATAFAVTPLFVGEPATAHGFGSPSDVVAALGLVSVAPPVALALAPRVQLIAARTATAHPALRWVSSSPVAAAGGAEIVAVVVCTVALADSPCCASPAACAPRCATPAWSSARAARARARTSIVHAGFAANRLVFAGVIVEIAVLVALVETPPLLAFPFVILGLEELRKCFVRARARGAAAKGDR